jgi:hypothetical protein
VQVGDSGETFQNLLPKPCTSTVAAQVPLDQREDFFARIELRGVLGQKDEVHTHCIQELTKKGECITPMVNRSIVHNEVVSWFKETYLH